MTRLAFSTLGCPEAGSTDVLDLARRYGFDGVELRAGPDQPVHTGLSDAQRQRVTRQLRESGVTPLSVASYVKIAAPGPSDQEVIDDGTAHLRLAADLGARFLRVFPGGDPDIADPAAQDRRATRRLAALAPVAADLGVTLALETHDSHRRAADIARILDHPGCDDVRVVWDTLHTWLGGETPAQTWTLLSDRVGYVQVKDVPSRDDLTPVLMGTGVLPLADVAAVLAAGGYDGWVSWEYERAWHPEQPSLADLGGRAAEWLRGTFSTDAP